MCVGTTHIPTSLFIEMIRVNVVYTKVANRASWGPKSVIAMSERRLRANGFNAEDITLPPAMPVLFVLSGTCVMGNSQWQGTGQAILQQL